MTKEVSFLQTATLQHEMTNPRDRNALILESIPPGSTLGYLPRSVSQHLAPLVKQDTLGSLAKVLELGSSTTAAINIVLEVAYFQIPPAFRKQRSIIFIL